MQIAILGGTGGIGRHVLGWALDAGHPLRALARRPEALPQRAGLMVVRGDALDATAVAETIVGADAVISALGPRGAKSPSLLAGAAANVVAAMEKTGARRLICVSAAGAYVAGDPDTGWLIKAVLPRVLVAASRAPRRAGCAGELAWDARRRGGRSGRRRRRGDGRFAAAAGTVRAHL
jgi:uncharacterized protein YbjT (DUF2867 family)